MVRYEALRHTLSDDRLRRYAGGGASEALTVARYVWNVALAEALYPSLNGLEIAFRNALHAAATEQYATPWWFRPGHARLHIRRNEAARVDEALRAIEQRHGRAATPGDVVAELTFGVWTGFLNRHYVNEGLWKRSLGRVFPNRTTDRTIGVVRPALERARRLRNRVFHHEPIWHWHDLAAQHRGLVATLGWISADAAALVRAIDRFAAVHAAGPEGISPSLQGSVHL